MDNFLAMERKGRDLFKSLLEDGNITKYKESTGRYNPVDFYLIHNEDKIVAEIKCRDIRYVNYPTHLMETEKLKSLLTVKDTHDCKAAWYVNFFGEDICFIYNADKVKNLRSETAYCNYTTANYNYYKTTKGVIMIPTNLAGIYVSPVLVSSRVRFRSTDTNSQSRTGDRNSQTKSSSPENSQ